jgi:hypothetical protein
MPNNALKTFLHIPSLRCYPSFGRIFLRLGERESKRALGVGLRRMRRCRQGAYSHSRPLAQHSTVGSLHPSCELLCPRFARRVSERERDPQPESEREERCFPSSSTNKANKCIDLRYRPSRWAPTSGTVTRTIECVLADQMASTAVD